MFSIEELIRESHKTAINHGWWDSAPEFGTLIALCHSELSEALQEYRNGHELDGGYVGDNGKPEGIPTELADVCIRIFDMCGRYGIDLEQAILDKMKYNRTRPYRHGNRLI